MLARIFRRRKDTARTDAGACGSIQGKLSVSSRSFCRNPAKRNKESQRLPENRTLFIEARHPLLIRKPFLPSALE
jgi:hypothetical protein